MQSTFASHVKNHKNVTFNGGGGAKLTQINPNISKALELTNEDLKIAITNMLKDLRERVNIMSEQMGED